MPDRPPVFVHLLPGLIPPGALEGGVAVVIDVLRATTMMIHALAAGAEAIIPCLEIDEARATADQLPAGTVVLAGERQGVPIEGFAMGNSPLSCTPELCSGKTMVATTTNGTRAILACLEAGRILIAGFVNLKATIDALKLEGRPVHLVCSGTDGLISLEDTMLAGAIAHRLDDDDWDRAEAEALRTGRLDDASLETLLANDQAEIAVALWRETEGLIDDGYTLADSLSDGRGGRRVLELGYDADLAAAADIDRFPFAAELLRDPLRIVPLDGPGAPRLRLFDAP